MATTSKKSIEEAQEKLEEAILLQLRFLSSLDLKEAHIKRVYKKGELNAVITFVSNIYSNDDWAGAEEKTYEFLLPSLRDTDLRHLSITAVRRALTTIPNARTPE